MESGPDLDESRRFERVVPQLPRAGQHLDRDFAGTEMSTYVSGSV